MEDQQFFINIPVEPSIWSVNDGYAAAHLKNLKHVLPEHWGKYLFFRLKTNKWQLGYFWMNKFKKIRSFKRGKEYALTISQMEMYYNEAKKQVEEKQNFFDLKTSIEIEARLLFPESAIYISSSENTFSSIKVGFENAFVGFSPYLEDRGKYYWQAISDDVTSAIEALESMKLKYGSAVEKFSNFLEEKGFFTAQ